MKYVRMFSLTVLCLQACVVGASADSFDMLANYVYGQDRCVLQEISRMVNKTYGDTAARYELEKKLITILESNTATRDGKAFACEMLGRIGTSFAVFPLAKLLREPVLADYALIALGRIPQGEANRALRESLPGLEGDAVRGVIQVLGSRGADISVDTLAGFLDIPEYAGDAAAALGDLGTSEASQRLTVARAKKGSDAMLEMALLDCANGPAGEQIPEHAAAIYEFLYREGVSDMLKVAGFNGMLQHHDAVQELLQEALTSETPYYSRAVLSALGEPGLSESVAEALKSVLDELPHEIQSEIIPALAARTDIPPVLAALPSVTKTQVQEESPTETLEQQNASILDEDPIFPDGYKIVSYLDCGGRHATQEGRLPAISITAGADYIFPEVDGAVGSVAFDPEQVTCKISGLKPDSDYVFGFTWWDADASGRIQSVRFSQNGASWDTVVPPVVPAAFNKDKSTWARVLLPLASPYNAGETLHVAFVKETGPNAVVSELFLLERVKPARDKRVLIVTGDDYAGHVWRDTAPVLAAVLREDSRLEVSINECPAVCGSPLLNHYDAIVLHFKNYGERLPLGKECIEGLKSCVAAGKGLVLVHFACGAFQEHPEFATLAGRIWNPAFRAHDPHGIFEVQVKNTGHPITRELEAFQTVDELYTCLDGGTPITVLCEAVSKVDQKPYPMAFIVEDEGERVFHSVLGHDPAAFQADGVRRLYRQATAWAAGL